MNLDPITTEVRTIRREISAEFGHDLQRYLQHLRAEGDKLRAAGEFKVLSEHEAEALSGGKRLSAAK